MIEKTKGKNRASALENKMIQTMSYLMIFHLGAIFDGGHVHAK